MKLKKVLAWIVTMCMLIIQLPQAMAEEEAKMSIVSLSIEDGARDISPINLQLDMTFSEAVDASTLKMSNLSVSGNGYAAIIATGEKTATLYFNRYSIIPGTKYTVTLKSGIKSVSGKSLEAKSITFTISKNIPSYRQMTNPGMDDANNIYGLESEAWSNSAIINDNGNNVLQFTPGWDEASVRQRVYVKTGYTYVARARIKADSATKARLVLTYNIPGDQNNYHAGPDVELKAGQWTDLEYSWTVDNKADLSEVKQWIAVLNAGVTVYIDDWYFFEDGHDEDPPKAEISSSSASNMVRMGNQSIDKMKAFGVIPNGISENAELTRLDLARVILNIIEYDYAADAKAAVGFTDVDEASSGIVAAISELGIMNGYDDTTFGPDDSVMTEQVIKVILSIMGWSKIAENQGGNNKGYYQIGAEMGLLKNTGLKGGAVVTYGALAKILDNILEEDVLTVDFSRTKNGNPSLTKSNTFLEEYFGYVKAEGIIEGTPETYLYSSANMGENQVCIGGVNFSSDVDLSQYIGCKVKYYYDEIDGDDNKLVYVYDIGNRNKIVDISTVNSDVSFDNNTYHVWSDEGNKQTHYRLENEISIIYNGKYLGEYTNTEETYVPAYGSIRLIDNGQGYNVVIITDLETMHVGSVDYDKEIIYDRLSNISVNISDCTVLSIKDKDGADYKINDIKPYNVLSVARSKDGEIVKMYIASESLTGTVSGVSKGDEPTILIGDELYGSNVRTSYKTVKGFFESQNVNTGMTGTFFFDYLGNVAAFRSGASLNNVGYLVNAVCYEGDTGTEMQVKIFNMDGQMVKLKAAENIKIDTSTAKTAEIAMQRLMNETGAVVSQLILYDTNLEGEVSFIDTAYNKLPHCQDYRTVQPKDNDNADGFRVVYSSILPPNPSSPLSTISFSPTARSFNGKVQLTEDAKLIYVPLNAKTDDDAKFYISDNVWDLGDLGAETIEAYQTRGNAIAVDVVVVYLPEDRYMTNHVGEYKKGLVLDKDSEIIDGTLTFTVNLIDGTKLYTDDESLVQNIDVGDYISCRRDAYNYMIGSANVILDVSERAMSSSNPYGSFGDWDRMMFAKVYDKDDNVLRLVPHQYDPGNSESLLSAETTDISKAKVYVYSEHKKKRNIEKASSGDILDYKNSGSSCSEVIILYQDDIPQSVVILK